MNIEDCEDEIAAYPKTLARKSRQMLAILKASQLL